LYLKFRFAFKASQHFKYWEAIYSKSKFKLRLGCG
jgi:hypothetical protein